MKHVFTAITVWFYGSMILFLVVPTVGGVLLVACLIVWCLLTAIRSATRCPKGHTDFGFYNGRWICGTCYRRHQRWLRKATQAEIQAAVRRRQAEDALRLRRSSG